MDIPIVVPTTLTKKSEDRYEIESEIRTRRIYIEDKPALDNMSQEELLIYSSLIAEINRREQDAMDKAERDTISKTPGRGLIGQS